MVQPKQSKNGNCERCQGEGALFLFVREGEKRTPVVLLGEIPDVDDDRPSEFTLEMRENTAIIDTPDYHSVESFEREELVREIESMPRKEEQVEEEQNVTETEIEQLKARIAKLEQYLKENTT